jgi:hypothetical protein
MKMLHKLRIALAATLLALAAVSAVDSASARANGGGSYQKKLEFGEAMAVALEDKSYGP